VGAVVQPVAAEVTRRPTPVTPLDASNVLHVTEVAEAAVRAIESP